MRRVNSLWVAVGLALAGLALPSAHANCGYYVHTGGELLANTAGKPRPDTQPVPVKHCSGPACSESPLPLSSPPSSPVPVEDPRWCDTHAPQPAPPQGDLHFFPLSADAARPLFGGCSIYHPPR